MKDRTRRHLKHSTARRKNNFRDNYQLLIINIIYIQSEPLNYYRRNLLLWTSTYVCIFYVYLQIISPAKFFFSSVLVYAVFFNKRAFLCTLTYVLIASPWVVRFLVCCKNRVVASAEGSPSGIVPHPRNK